jgi:hypothetical protein
MIGKQIRVVVYGYTPGLDPDIVGSIPTYVVKARCDYDALAAFVEIDGSSESECSSAW